MIFAGYQHKYTRNTYDNRYLHICTVVRLATYLQSVELSSCLLALLQAKRQSVHEITLVLQKLRRALLVHHRNLEELKIRPRRAPACLLGH